MPNPANAFLKFSSVGVTEAQHRPWEGQPQGCSHPASLHPLQTLLQLFGYILIQGLH